MAKLITILSTVVTFWNEVQNYVGHWQYVVAVLRVWAESCKDFWTRTKSKRTRWFRTFRKVVGYVRPFIIAHTVWRVIVWLWVHGWPF